MTELPRRFYKTAAAVGDAAPFGVALDGRPVRTPGKAALALPTHALSEAIAQEWQAQGERIDPYLMPLTKLANTAIDRVAPDRARIEAELIKFAGHDLVCYRAGAPEELHVRQVSAWDPVIAWAMEALDAGFAVTNGIVHIEQPQASLEALGRRLRQLSPWTLTALHNMATLSQSLLIAAMCAEGALDVEAAWAKAHVDEDWQIEHWGEDAEAAARRERRRQEFLACRRFIDLSGG